MAYERTRGHSNSIRHARPNRPECQSSLTPQGRLDFWTKPAAGRPHESDSRPRQLENTNMKNPLALSLLLIASLLAACSLSEPPKKRSATESPNAVIESPESVVIPADVQSVPPEATASTAAPVRRIPTNLPAGGLRTVKPRAFDRTMLVSPKLRMRQREGQPGLEQPIRTRKSVPVEAPVEAPHTDLE